MSDPNLALFYEFARNKSLVASKGLGPTFDIVRAGGAATQVNELGLIETVAANIPRFNHDPVTLKSLGLLIEESRTNLCLQSETFNVAPWTTFISPIINKVALAPDGSLNATNINDNNGAGFEAVVQQVSIPNDSAIYTFGMYIKKTAAGSAPTMGVNIVLRNGTNPGNLPIPRIFTDTGFVQDLQAGANSRIVDAGDYWRLVSTVANNSTGHTIIEDQIYPATANNGFLPNISQAIGINTVWGMQHEIGSFATSYIPNPTGGVVIRAADVPKTTDISNINTFEGVFSIDFTTGNIDNNTTVLSLDSEMSSNRMALEIVNGNIRFRGVADGVAQWNISTAATADTDYRAAMAYKGNDIEFWLNGTQVGVDSLATIPTFTTLHIGCDFNEREQLNEHVRGLRHYNIRKPSRFLEALSSGLISEDNDLTFIRTLARPLERPLANTMR